MAAKRRVRVDGGKAVAQPDFSVPVVRSSADPPAPEPEEDEDDQLCTCPRLDRADWHEVESDWSDLAFVKSAATAAMGVPINYQSARKGLVEAAKKVGATVPEGAMTLIGEGKFRRPVLLEVEDVPDGAKGIERPGGIAFSRLVPAPLGQMKQVVADTVGAARERYGRKPDDTWLWYLTCRICSGPRDFETLIIAHYREAPGS